MIIIPTKNTRFTMKRLLTYICLTFTLISGSIAADSYKGEVDRSTLPELQAQGALIIDVRTPAEWKDTGVIKGSVRITYMDNEGRVDKPAFLKMVEDKTMSKDDLIVLVCRTGVRSKKAAEWLAKEGYTNIYNKTHGIKECLRFNKDKLTKDFY